MYKQNNVMTLEIIAQNILDIKLINLSNATRIEFCVHLKNGGLSPSIRKIKKAAKVAQKDLMIMLRVHDQDFFYNDEKLRQLLKIIDKTKHLPFKGYVFGAITKNYQIDQEALNLICQNLPEDKEITFHKAFDWIEEPIAAINILKQYPHIKRILTGGPANQTLINNLPILKKWKAQNLEILTGGGINKNNFSNLLEHQLYDLHLGREARINNDFKNKIDIDKINSFFQSIKEKNNVEI